MSVACPMSTRRVDERVVRISALLICSLAIAAIFTDLRWIGIVLAVDFLIRGFSPWAISYVALLGRIIAWAIGLEPQPINAGPKTFAARIGFFVAATATVLAFLTFDAAATAVIVILATFAALEGLLDICVGCHMYTLLMKVRGRA